jgi:hypothetical protein
VQLVATILAEKEPKKAAAMRPREKRSNILYTKMCCIKRLTPLTLKIWMLARSQQWLLLIPAVLNKATDP